MEPKYVDLSSNVVERRSAFSVYSSYRQTEATYGDVDTGIYEVIAESPGISQTVAMETDSHDYVLSWLTNVDVDDDDDDDDVVLKVSC